MEIFLDMSSSQRRDIRQIGWREIVGFPELGIPALKAKIDTGARTTALHAVDLKPFEKDGEPWIRFRVPGSGMPKNAFCEARLVDQRKIKNTSGEPDLRYVIETLFVLGTRSWLIEVSLANRQKMAFPVIVGRTAIRRQGLLVDPGRSFVAGDPDCGGKITET